jgi:phage baseplate assembly protein W
MATTRQFSDIDLTFQPNPVTGDIRLSVGSQAIIRSVRNLVLTNHWERPFNSQLGSNVRRMLFEPISPVNANILQREISDVINNFEPRVNLQEVFVQPDPDYNYYQVQVTFFIINSADPITLNFILNRLR